MIFYHIEAKTIISQTTLSAALSWMRMLEFLLKFNWSLFLSIQLTIFSHWFRLWLGADQTTSHYLNQWWLDNWCIYASLSRSELNVISWLDNEILHLVLVSSYTIPSWLLDTYHGGIRSYAWLLMSFLLVSQVISSHSIDFMRSKSLSSMRNNSMSGIILWMCPANEWWRYIVTPSLIGWVHIQNNPCYLPAQSTHWEMI